MAFNSGFKRLKDVYSLKCIRGRPSTMSRATSARYGLSGLLWEAAVAHTQAHPTMWIKVNTSRLVDILDPLCVEDVKFARVWTLNCWLCRQTGCRSVSIVTVTIASEWQRQNTAFSLIHILLHVLILSVLLLKAGRAFVNHNTWIRLQLNWGPFYYVVCCRSWLKWRIWRKFI